MEPIHHDSSLRVGGGSDQENAILGLLPYLHLPPQVRIRSFSIATLLQRVISVPFQSQFATITIKFAALLGSRIKRMRKCPHLSQGDKSRVVPTT